MKDCSLLEYWKTVKTPLAEGNRIQYNFVKPHMALEGKTPAQAAGIDGNGGNKWAKLLTTALTKKVMDDKSNISHNC